MRKYEITDRTMNKNGVTLHQIRAVVDIDDLDGFGISKGDLGGWIEKEENLSHEGTSWVGMGAFVYENAHVFGNAKILGDAEIYGYAQVYGRSIVHGRAKIFDRARACENSRIYGMAKVYEDSQVSGFARVTKYAKIYGYSCVGGTSVISGNAKIFGCSVIDGRTRICNEAFIEKRSDYLVIGPIGSRDDFTTFYRSKRGKIMVCCGCFSGTVDEFMSEVDATHGQNKHAVAYQAVSELAWNRIDTTPINKVRSEVMKNG